MRQSVYVRTKIKET